MVNEAHVMSSLRDSALGAGAKENLDNELIEAPEEEEEFDLLNDETFGNCEGDWDEEEHKRLAELELEGESFFDFHVPDHTKDSGYGNAERSFRSQEELLEQSISRMMDETEEDDKGRQFFGRGQPIPHSGKQHGEAHLDQLFGPSSPPALMDTQQLVSPKSKNIWATSDDDSVFQKPADALRKLFDTAKAGQSAGRDTHVIAARPPLPNQSPMALPQAHTLEEIERQMLSRGRKPQVLTAEELERQLRGEEPPRTHSTTPQFVNHHPQIGPPPPLPPADDVQPMVSEVPPSPVNHQATVAAAPAPTHLPPGLLPASALMGASSRSPFPAPPMAGPHPMGHPMPPPVTPKHPTGMQPPMSNGRSSPIPIQGLPQQFMHAGSPQMTPGQNLSSSLGRSTSTPTPPLVRAMPPHIPTAHATRLINAYSLASAAAAMGSSPVTAGFGNRMMTPPPGVPPHMPLGPIPHLPPPLPLSPMGTPPNTRLPVPPVLQDTSPQVRHPHPVVDRRPENGNQQGVASDKHRAYRTNYQRPPPWQNQPQRQEHLHPRLGEDGEEDEYAGLMTKKEKDWIIKIQLLQLNTDNPYLDDYYYTYYVLRKQHRESGSVEGMERFLIPNLARIESKAYAPAQFEGSLGRLTTASVHNPRHIIDVSRGSSPTEDTSKKNVSKELRKFRQLLMDIEKGYTLLLDIDDIEKKVLALPDEARMPLFMERQEMIGQLYQYFTCDESIEQYLHIMGVRKGRKLLGRVLPLFSKNQAHVALCILFHHMHALVKKDTMEDGLKCLTRPVCSAIEGSDLESLVRLFVVLKGEKPSQTGAFLQPLFRNQFGAVVVCSLVNEGEKVFRDTSPVDMDNQLQTEWHQFVEQFAEGLDSVPVAQLPAPSTPSSVALPLVEAHLSRQLNAQLVGRVEEKVQHLTTTTTPPPAPQTTSSSSSSSSSAPSALVS
ncbi:uncharacterized protein LOC143298052 [Babylonia areolata]|uniref:uncharacterized protein LOC143298052 n=1 Tax=Babylonia areolata TaxID=304850 RepID=UPI003FD5D862